MRMPVAKKKNVPQPWLLRYAQCKRCETSSCAVNMVASSLRWLHVSYLFWRWQAYPKIYKATCRASDVLQKMCKGGARTVDMGNLASRTTAGNATPCQTTTLSLLGNRQAVWCRQAEQMVASSAVESTMIMTISACVSISLVCSIQVWLLPKKGN